MRRNVIIATLALLFAVAGFRPNAEPPLTPPVDPHPVWVVEPGEYYRFISAIACGDARKWQNLWYATNEMALVDSRFKYNENPDLIYAGDLIVIDCRWGNR